MASKNLKHLIKAPLRQLHHSLRAAYDLLRAQPRPLLVYQMGKVGSSSVCDALLAAGLRPLQVHVLGKKSAESRRRFAEQGLPLPYHKYVERLLRAYLSHSDFLARRDIGGTADDRHRLRVPDIDRTNGKLLGVRVALVLGDVTDHNIRELRREGLDAFDLGGGECQIIRELCRGDTA